MLKPLNRKNKREKCISEYFVRSSLNLFWTLSVTSIYKTCAKGILNMSTIILQRNGTYDVFLFLAVLSVTHNLVGIL